MLLTINFSINSPKISDLSKRDIFQHNSSQNNFVLSCRFHQCLEPFNTLLAKGCSQTVLFRHLSNYIIFESRILDILKPYGSSFFKKPLKFHVDCKKAIKNWENKFASYIVTFPLVKQNSPYNDKNTCHWRSIYQQTFLRL